MAARVMDERNGGRLRRKIKFDIFNVTEILALHSRMFVGLCCSRRDHCTASSQIRRKSPDLLHVPESTARGEVRFEHLQRSCDRFRSTNVLQAWSLKAGVSIVFSKTRTQEWADRPGHQEEGAALKPALFGRALKLSSVARNLFIHFLT